MPKFSIRPAIFDHPLPRRVFPGRTSWSLMMRKLLTLWIALAAIALASVLAHAFGCRGWPQIAGGNGCNSSIATGGSSCSGWTPATPSGLIGWYNADSANVSPNTNGGHRYGRPEQRGP
jgi:hypothetical protein